MLPGMTNATFILTGTFSGDGSANNAAYTADQNGRWGLIVPEERGELVPSGKGVDDQNTGVGDGIYFANGQLETADCSSTLPFAECGGNNRVIKYWTWHMDGASGSGSFVFDHGAGLSH